MSLKDVNMDGGLIRSTQEDGLNVFMACSWAIDLAISRAGYEEKIGLTI